MCVMPGDTVLTLTPSETVIETADRPTNYTTGMWRIKA